MNNTYTVILDACVLYPAPLRSYLMYLASTGLLEPDGRSRYMTNGFVMC